MPRLSLRGLVALLYLGSILPLLLLLGGLVYYEYRAFLIAEHTATMQDLVHAVIGVRSSAPGQTLPLPRLGDLLVEQMEGTDFAVVLLNAGGQPLAQSAGAETWLVAGQSAAVDASGAQTRTVTAPDGERVLYLLPIRNPGGALVGTIAASFSTRAVLTELQPLTFWLLLTVGGVGLLALLVTPLLTQLATRPVLGLVETARQVAQGNLDRRATLPPISELRDLATTFNTMLDQIQRTLQIEQQTSAALRQFVADAAHELRSPLAVLRGSVEVWQMAQQRGDTAEVQQAAALTHAEIEGMGRLVDDLLLLARMDHAAERLYTPLHRVELEPLPLLEEVAERARLLATGQELVLDWPRVDLEPLQADADLLRRALNNLLENALRYTPAGQRISLTVMPEAGGCAFVVRDEGCGIAPEHLPRLFERFYQVDDARTRQRGSSGLGLAIVRAIAEAHGGNVRLKSMPGQGTTVTLWLPMPGSIPPTRSVSMPMPATRPTPDRSIRRRRIALLLGSGLLLTLLIGGGIALLPAVADRQPADQLAALIITEAPSATSLPPTAAPLPPPVPAAPGAGFDAAAQRAMLHLGEGIPLEVAHLPEEGATIYEVVFSDRTEVYLDLGTGAILEVERETGGNGRGAEQRRIQLARVAGLVAHGTVTLSFDAAAAAAQAAAPGAGPAREVELEWRDESAQLVYSVELASGAELLLDVQTGALLEWDE